MKGEYYRLYASPEAIEDMRNWLPSQEQADILFNEEEKMSLISLEEPEDRDPYYDMDPKLEASACFISGFNELAYRIENWANVKGWNNDDPLLLFKKLADEDCHVLLEEEKKSMLANYDIAKYGLMGTEIAEAIEGRRHGDPKSDKIPEFTSQEEELADLIVRVMHHAAHRKLRVAEALVAKLDYNDKRPYKHGKLA